MQIDITTLPDDEACMLGIGRFAYMMQLKLSKKHADGRRGWNYPGECSMEDLCVLLADAVRKGDPVNIANFAMMIWNREHPHG